MQAIIYKICQLLKCRQTINYGCLSSNGLISLHPSHLCSNNLVPHAIYNKYQNNVCDKLPSKPIRKICSWNIQELWWHSYSGHKINNIINYITKSDYDVLCLQEVFEPDILQTIITHPKISAKYPYFLTGDLYNRFIIGENSGLLVLSSQPILFRQFTPFHTTTLPDIFASKGALYFTIGENNFITTHLQSVHVAIALRQLAFILNNSPFTSKTILLGDLNIPDPYPFLKLPRNNKKHTHDSGKTLDHIIPIQNDINLSKIDVDYINLKNTSDHWPILATIT